MSAAEFPVGTTVLAKLKGFPAWPAVVVRDSDVAAAVAAARPKKKEVYPVLFYNDNNFMWASAAELRILDPAEAAKAAAKSKKKRGLATAYEIAAAPPPLDEYLESLSAPPTSTGAPGGDDEEAAAPASGRGGKKAKAAHGTPRARPAAERAAAAAEEAAQRRATRAAERPVEVRRATRQSTKRVSAIIGGPPKKRRGKRAAVESDEEAGDEDAAAEAEEEAEVDAGADGDAVDESVLDEGDVSAMSVDDAAPGVAGEAPEVTAARIVLRGPKPRGRPSTTKVKRAPPATLDDYERSSELRSELCRQTRARLQRALLTETGGEVSAVTAANVPADQWLAFYAYVTQISELTNLEISIVRSTRVNRLLRAALAVIAESGDAEAGTPDLPEYAEKFAVRARELLAKWDTQAEPVVRGRPEDEVQDEEELEQSVEPELIDGDEADEAGEADEVDEADGQAADDVKSESETPAQNGDADIVKEESGAPNSETAKDAAAEAPATEAKQAEEEAPAASDAARDGATGSSAPDPLPEVVLEAVPATEVAPESDAAPVVPLETSGAVPADSLANGSA